MKLVTSGKGRFRFHLQIQEKRALCKLLKLYPLIPASHHKLSHSCVRTEDQELLEESLAQQRAAHRRQVLSLLKSKSRFRRVKAGCTLSLKPAQMEWLLQVLNDLRVGSWLLLGSPDGPAQMYAALNGKSLPHFWALEMSDQFQMCLLEAISGDSHANSQQ